MKILLDENLNWRLERFLPGHACSSVPRIGWAGVKNGQLLQQAAAAGFQVLISMDGSLATQQNVGSLSLAIVVGSFILGLCYVIGRVVSAVLGG